MGAPKNNSHSIHTQFLQLFIRKIVCTILLKSNKVVFLEMFFAYIYSKKKRKTWQLYNPRQIDKHVGGVKRRRD